MAASSHADQSPDTKKLAAGDSVLQEPAERLCRYVGSVSEPPITPEAVKGITQAVRLLRELLTFAVPSGPELPRSALEAGRDALAKLESLQYAEKIFLQAGEHSRGRAVKRRHVAAKALKTKQENPRLRRLELARQFCSCGRKGHTNDCAKRLYRDMKRLKALIRRILASYPA
jgi:hypothetical protein